MSEALDRPYRPRSADDVVYPDLAASFAYWDDLRDGRAMPSWKEFDMLELPLGGLPRCLVVNVIADGGGDYDFVYRFFGTGMVELHYGDFTGRPVRDLAKPDTGKMLHGQYIEIIEKKVPMIFINTIRTERMDYAHQAVLRLPMSTDGKTVDVVMSMSDFGRDAEDAKRQVNLSR